MYCIVKYIKVDKKELPVIILNSQDEILEFDAEEKAEDFKSILQMNSDSGYRYVVKKIWWCNKKHVYLLQIIAFVAQ